MSEAGSDRDLQAAEYVLGVLTPEQARALEALALHDPAVADSIAAWQELLAPLAAVVPPQAPPPLLWRRLALATGMEAAPLPRLNVWRGVAAASLAIAACLAFLLLRPAPEPVGLLAVLTPAGAPAPGFVVRVAPDGRAVVQTVEAKPPPGASFELWALPPGATAPVSLGVLPAEAQRQLVIENRAGTKLLVSREPPGGSPTGQPTGPVVFSGTLAGG